MVGRGRCGAGRMVALVQGSRMSGFLDSGLVRFQQVVSRNESEKVASTAETNSRLISEINIFRTCILNNSIYM